MKKFDGIVLISDIDGTLISSEWEISHKNIAAVKYFTQNGGKFTFATGRQVPCARPFTEQIFPDLPVICFNGAAIYDFSKNEFLWSDTLDCAGATEVVRDIYENCPYTSIEISGPEYVHMLRMYPPEVPRHSLMEEIFIPAKSLEEVPSPWYKILFAMKQADVDHLRKFISSRPYAQSFQFFQSSPCYYELLKVGTNKGKALNAFREIANLKDHKIIAVGDNENDIPFLAAADMGVAVADGEKCLLDVAEKITVRRKEHALADIVEKLDKGIIEL